MSEGKQFLITGGAGFIGSHLAQACLSHGHRVRVLDNLATGLESNLEGMDVDFVQGDVRDEALLTRIMQGVDGVFHLAALPSVPRSVKDPYASHDNNITGVLKVLIAARDAGAKMVFAGSSSAYGDTEVLPKNEDMPVRPLSPYAVTKVAGEQYLQVFARVYGMPTAIVRYFNVFGPRQRNDSPYSGVIAKFCRAALEGEVCKIEGDGLQSRDFTYVADAARGTLLAMEKEVPGGEVINLAGGNRISLLDLVSSLSKLCGREVGIQHVADRPGDVKHSQADVNKALRLLGFETEYSFDEGLEKTLEWYKKEHPAPC